MCLSAHSWLQTGHRMTPTEKDKIAFFFKVKLTHYFQVYDNDLMSVHTAR